MYKLRDYQHEAVGACMRDLDREGNSLCVLPTGCHEIDYPILMADGSIKKVQEIKIGDYVKGFNSIPRQVTELHRGNENAFEIETRKGEKFRVNENHILHLQCTVPDKYYPATLDISVKDYLNLPKSRKHMYKLKKTETTINWSPKKVEMPYLLGVWLGDGSANCSQITNPDVEIIDYIKQFCSDNNLRYRKLSAPYGHSLTSLTEIPRRKRAFNLFRHTLEKYNLYNNKHIPEDYFLADTFARMALLAGILDSDGHYDQKKNVYDLCLSHEVLFDGVIRLVRSLGYFCTKRTRLDCNGKTIFRTTISGFGQEKIPCLVKRKQARKFGQKKNPLRTSFSVQPIGKMDYYGFSIDGEDKLYIDGQGFVQHNSGKSLVIAEIARKVDKPVLILQPSAEILAQNKAKLAHYVPPSDIGVYSASFGKRQIRKFTFATIQSIYKKPHLFKSIGLVLIDECDLVNSKNADGMFTSFLKNIGQNKVIGFTATPYRNMQAYHKNKYGGMESALTLKLINRINPPFWKRIVYNINNQRLFTEGHLCPLRYYDYSQFAHASIPMNKSRSDFDTDRFAHQLEIQRPTILDLINRASGKMRSILVFCNSVAEAENYARMVPNSASVSGKTPKAIREKIINDFKTFKIKVVFNVNCLSVGFDHPELDCIFMLRPTRSLRLYYQQLGRGIRTAERKEFCVVVDFTSNVKTMGKVESIWLGKEKRMFDAYPKWYLKTSTESNWHGKELYKMELKGK